MRIAIYGNLYQDKHIEALDRMFATLTRLGMQTYIEQRFHEYLTRHIQLPETACILTTNDFAADAALSIGGDGTFLKTAAWIGNKSIPIMGINTGHLGYLADVSMNDAEQAIEDIHNGNFQIESRSLIEVTADSPNILPNRFALNEVAILKNDSASMLCLDTKVNGIELTSYLGDGLVISTPTGSTAYNLSVGGPILQPNCNNWVISPIAAHSLTMRPLVLPDNSQITVTTRSSRTQSFRVSIDGQSVSFPIGTTLLLKKAPHEIKVMQRTGHDFAKTLRSKLMWGTDAR